MEKPLPEWLPDIAVAVRDLLRTSQALPLFREEVRLWQYRHDQAAERRAVWLRGRSEHFEVRLRKERPLRNRKAGPPEGGWEWEEYSYIQRGSRARVSPKQDEQGQSDTEQVMVAGWVPPDLSSKQAPDDWLHPLPLIPSRSLSLTDRYAVLAVIHDHFAAGPELINPWQRLESEADEEPSWRMLQRRDYELLTGSLCFLEYEDQSRLEGFVRDVEAHLAARESVWADLEPVYHRWWQRLTEAYNARTDKANGDEIWLEDAARFVGRLIARPKAAAWIERWANHRFRTLLSQVEPAVALAIVDEQGAVREDRLPDSLGNSGWDEIFTALEGRKRRAVRKCAPPLVDQLRRLCQCMQDDPKWPKDAMKLSCREFYELLLKYQAGLHLPYPPQYTDRIQELRQALCSTDRTAEDCFADEWRVLVKCAALRAAPGELPEIVLVENTPQSLSASELTVDASDPAEVLKALQAIHEAIEFKIAPGAASQGYPAPAYQQLPTRVLPISTLSTPPDADKPLDPLVSAEGNLTSRRSSVPGTPEDAEKAAIDQAIAKMKTFLSHDVDSRKGPNAPMKVPAATLLDAINFYPEPASDHGDGGNGTSKYLRETLYPKFPAARDCFVIQKRTVLFNRERFVQKLKY